MAVKAKRIKCARCGERETVTRGERGPASIYCDLCRDEVKREQNALRAQAYRQRKASYRGSALNAPPGAADFVGYQAKWPILRESL
jgi:late competence protein required for DNA uptake (superfamily II DNA/RNA helicase)